ncbi:PX-associated-domain-containing protein [Podospora fimiseda]|uniref:PX-associated-domain-containing protein n=1 Tax=Podospora fimiseda TaxID=252190 RepID=A0AAN7BLZ0_9PEZI|nr:PX-associated-domain-containing protein [Podospora fimiseda]
MEHDTGTGTPSTLSASQLHALFDILTHHETYFEIQSFKDPSTISSYGYPFAHHGSDGAPIYSQDSSAPLLTGFLRPIVLSFPGVLDLPSDFWHARFQGVMEKLAEAELSESYDKGYLDAGKILATAASSIHEAVSRGILGGIERGEKRHLDAKYDQSKAEDLIRAWEDGVHELLYGDLIDQLFKCAAERKSLEEHSPGVRAAADYIIIHLATLLHHVFVLSPEGPYLLGLLESVHKLLPYSMIKQTLRIGNAATMINGMMRLLLAKVGVGAISNWVGLTSNADDGMNLLQRIISLVLYWDTAESRKTVDRIEKLKGGSAPNKAQLTAIRDFIEKKPSSEHKKTRRQSIHDHMPMIMEILRRSDATLLVSLNDEQHNLLSQYYSSLLIIRDREEILNALCRQHPDLFTQAIKDLLFSFDSIIRTIHENIDLREYVTAAETFLTDLINVSKVTSSTKAPSPQSSSSGLLSSWTPGFLSKSEKISVTETMNDKTPFVEDYVRLLQNNKHLLYNWFHQVAIKCPDLTEEFRIWAHDTIKVFRQNNKCIISTGKAAGALSSNLQYLFSSLPESSRAKVIPAIDAQAKHLEDLVQLSNQRMQRILDNLSSPTKGGESGLAGGPGVYLAKWQDLMDETLIGPLLPGERVRKGKDLKVREFTKDEESPDAPDVGCVIEALGMRFRGLVGDLLKKDERFKVKDKSNKKRHCKHGME